MARKLAAVAAVLMLACSTANAQDVKTALDNAARTMGAVSLRTIEFSGAGSHFQHGQAVVPFAELPRFNVTSFSYAADYVTPGSRMERVRSQAGRPRGGGPQPFVEERSLTYLSGEHAWGLTTGGTAPPSATPRTPGRQADGEGERQIQLWGTPYGFLIAALRNTATTIKEQWIGGKRFRVVSFSRDRTRMDGYINDENLVEKVETWMHHPVLGDMSVEFSYADYRDWNGVKFPTRVTQRWAGEVILDLTIRDVKPNVAIDLTVPENVRNAPPPAPARIASRKEAEGVYTVAGQANTVVVEFRDFVVAIEAPIDEARSLAVIAEVKRLYPSKPIRYLINTHAQYNDHAGGVRAWAAEGVPFITHKASKKWFDEVA